MPSSTFNSDYPVPNKPWVAVGTIAALVLVLGIAFWEFAWRQKSFEPGFVDNDGLWANARRKIGSHGNRDIAIVGSSRILFDLDLKILAEALQGPRPIQLALAGTNPRPMLSDIASDPNFKGLLLVGVTPGLFFSAGQGEFGGIVERFQKQTPSQRIGQNLSEILEARFAFLEPDLAMGGLLERLPWRQREGMRPPFLGVRKLAVMDRYREADMWRRIVEDEAYREQAKQIWQTILSFPRRPPKEGHLEEVMASVAADVKAIRDRGGNVVFIRCPSSGPFLEAEQKGLPRAAFWDALLNETGAPGIHFQDHTQLMGFDLPEWSHLNATDKQTFTKTLADLLKPHYPPSPIP